mgnify:CR=1 FL=1
MGERPSQSRAPHQSMRVRGYLVGQRNRGRETDTQTPPGFLYSCTMSPSFCHPEFMRSSPSPAVADFMAAVGRVGWRLEEGPATGTSKCSAIGQLAPPRSHPRACRCLVLPTLRPEAVSAFYHGHANPESQGPAQWPTLHFSDGTIEGAAAGTATVAVAVSRVGVQADGINPRCSGGSAVRVNIGKAGQLECRRALAGRLGCQYDALELQAAQYDLSRQPDCLSFLRDAWQAQQRHRRQPAAAHAFLLKPAIGSFGRNIRYVPPDAAYEMATALCGPTRAQSARASSGSTMVAMRYVQPLLLGGRKLDARSYTLISRTRPQLVWWHRGFARRCDKVFNVSDPDPHIHVSNIGHHNPEIEPFETAKDHFYDFDDLGVALHREHGLAADLVATHVTAQMKNISVYAFRAMQDPQKAWSGLSQQSMDGRDASWRGGRSRSLGTWQVHAMDWGHRAVGPREPDRGECCARHARLLIHAQPDAGPLDVDV